MNPVISPNILNILGNDFGSQGQNQEPEPQPQPEPKKPFWQKVGDFCNKVYTAIKPVLEVITVVAVALNAFARFRNAFGRRNRSQRAWGF